MRIVMIGTDKSLIGGRALGDAVERHRRYGEFVDSLDVIVYANKKENLREFKISEKVIGHPSQSRTKALFIFDAVRIFKKIYRRNKIDIVVCQDPFVMGLVGVMLKLIYGVKLQINFHGDFWQNQNWLKENPLNYLYLLLSKIIVRFADAIRAMSEGQKKKLVDGRIAGEKIHVISTPVRITKYAMVDLEVVKKMRNEVTVPIILHVSRNDEVKGFDTLFAALELIAQKIDYFTFWQVGAGFTLEELKEKFPGLKVFTNKNITLKFDPMKNAEALISVFHAADVFILSSNSESFGKVLVEANACGKPVVSTATTGAQEIIEDGQNGFLVPIGDAKALAEKVCYLLENPDVALKMGEEGKKMVTEKYGDNTKKIVQLWQKLMNESV